MNRIDQKFSVPFEFPVIFTNGIFDPSSTVLLDTINRPAEEAPHRAMVFVEETVLRSHPGLSEKITAWFLSHSREIKLAALPQILAGGEEIKNDFNLVKTLSTRMLAAHLSRHAYVIIVGGGALLDAVGFAASLVHRGLRQVRVPTTVLSQNDGGVGVKNGINFAGQKNALGVFAPPWAVINDFEFLKSLGERQWLDGVAEAFKVSIIRDKSFFDYLVSNAAKLRDCDPEVMRRLIFRCAELHLEHIRTNRDPFEFGHARPLDFGHWSAHKLETMSDFKVSHGEAVAVGILLDSLTPSAKAGSSAPEFDAIHAAFIAKPASLWLDELETQRAPLVPASKSSTASPSSRSTLGENFVLHIRKASAPATKSTKSTSQPWQPPSGNARVFLNPPPATRQFLLSRNHIIGYHFTNNMRALRFDKTGSLDDLSIQEVPMPVPAAGEVLVQVKAAAINPSDIKHVLGKMHQTTVPRIPGRDFAGIVVEGPAELAGKSVFGSGGSLGFGRDGSHAEYVTRSGERRTAAPGEFELRAGRRHRCRVPDRMGRDGRSRRSPARGNGACSGNHGRGRKRRRPNSPQPGRARHRHCPQGIGYSLRAGSPGRHLDQPRDDRPPRRRPRRDEWPRGRCRLRCGGRADV